jgi:hypothetical protein
VGMETEALLARKFSGLPSALPGLPGVRSCNHPFRGVRSARTICTHHAANVMIDTRHVTHYTDA